MADVLIIDDDKVICDILAKMMSLIGHESRYAVTGREGLELAQDNMFDIVFLDVNLPDANGLDLIKIIKSAPSSPQVIIITGDSDPDGAEMAISSGAWNYLVKPFLRQELTLQVSRALQFRKEKGKVSAPGVLKRHGIIGESDVIKSCLDQVSIAAYSDINVLISGEQGTGKELFAKTIHLNSDRSDNKFAVVDCSAINDTIAEGVLFGYEKGAFPGAWNDKPGLIKLADGGTLFLDEVSKLPFQVQKSFLRVLESSEFIPLGQTDPKISNFRVIAATNKDLDDLCLEGKFRKDLLFKLKGINIHLPCLKEMKEDVIKIAISYIDHYCRKYKIDTKGVSPEFLDIIGDYEWPGNVRELINAMEKAVASAKNEPNLYSIHLPSYVKARVIKRKLISKGIVQKEFPLLNAFMEDAEKKYLTALFSYTNGNVKKGCDISGVSKSCMYARLKKYRIN